MAQGDRTLVVMTNGDVYYLSIGDAEALTEALAQERYKVYNFTDLKSGSKVSVNLRNISSLVKEADRG